MGIFFVPGLPVPKGSAKAFMRKGSKFPVVVQDNAEKQKPWASMIGYTAHQNGVSKIIGPVCLHITFVMPHLKSHYGTGRNAHVLKPSVPRYHTSKPDLDKLIRCVKDALTGIAWKDDCQVGEVKAIKIYGEREGAFIGIKPL